MHRKATGRPARGRRYLKGSVVLREAMGDHLLGSVLAVRGAEDSLFAGRTRAETVQATRWCY
ncbi:hypothetical protein HNQ79_005421 [Streptomyces candidus]|uniref:Uncharacterized protein n=1 Tax=Streptomyces candidus TaxID=67283 RepID=A0A7X0HJP6_9ACTN|nr:hypothetical protein [Streptomyces candidus]GHH52503.1 hypothetical protein GCM10018773_52610 [Streptomyces candidus]